MKELIENYVAIWNSNGIADLQTVFSKDATYWDATQTGEAIVVLNQSISSTYEAFSDVEFQVVGLQTTAEGQFFLEWQMTGVNTGTFFGYPPTGKSIEIKGLDAIQVASNKIIEIKSFYDSSLFSQQLGLQ